jgi:hypothetical protein
MTLNGEPLPAGRTILTGQTIASGLTTQIGQASLTGLLLNGRNGQLNKIGLTGITLRCSLTNSTTHLMSTSRLLSSTDLNKL